MDLLATFTLPDQVGYIFLGAGIAQLLGAVAWGMRMEVRQARTEAKVNELTSDATTVIADVKALTATVQDMRVDLARTAESSATIAKAHSDLIGTIRLPDHHV